MVKKKKMAKFATRRGRKEAKAANRKCICAWVACGTARGRLKRGSSQEGDLPSYVVMSSRKLFLISFVWATQLEINARCLISQQFLLFLWLHRISVRPKGRHAPRQPGRQGVRVQQLSKHWHKIPLQIVKKKMQFHGLSINFCFSLYRVQYLQLLLPLLLLPQRAPQGGHKLSSP